MSRSRLTSQLHALASQPLRIQRLSRIPFAPLRKPYLVTSRPTRYYSQATEPEAQTKQEKDEGSQTGETGNVSEPADSAKEELEAKKKELIEVTVQYRGKQESDSVLIFHQDRLKRSVAEYRNLQEQTKREVQAARDYAIQRFAKDLIESIDNLDRALTTVPEDKLGSDGNKELLDLHGGLRMTERILLETVKRHGLERFDPSESGDKFDPNKHEATFQAPQEGKADGTVFYTQSKGYSLNGRVLKAAKVGVVKNA